MPDPIDPAADEKKAAAAEEKHLELAEQNAKLAEKLEATAQRVASIAEHVAERPTVVQQPAAAAQPVARLTEDQLMAAVEAKQITMAQAMAYQRRLATEDAAVTAQRTTQAALAELGSRAVEHGVVARIAEYKKAIPALAQKHSPEWNAAATRWSQLVAEGYPETIQTELTALREIYGRDPAKAAEREEPRERTKERLTRGQETRSSASARSEPGRSRRSANEPDPDLPADHKTYVEHMIRIGQYKGWDDPKVAKYTERAKQPRKARAG